MILKDFDHFLCTYNIFLLSRVIFSKFDFQYSSWMMFNTTGTVIQYCYCCLDELSTGFFRISGYQFLSSFTGNLRKSFNSPKCLIRIQRSGIIRKILPIFQFNFIGWNLHPHIFDWLIILAIKNVDRISPYDFQEGNHMEKRSPFSKN